MKIGYAHISGLRSIYLAACVIIFIAGLTTYSVKSYQQSQAVRQLQYQDIEPARAYILTLHVIHVDAKGARKITAIDVQEVDAEGNWVVKRTFVGRPGEIRTEVKEHNFSRTDTRGNQITRTTPPAKDTELFRNTRSKEFLRNHQNLQGTETIAGLEVYKLRAPEVEGEWLEQAFSPKTGYIPLKFIHHRADGTELVIEAVKVEFK